MWLIESPEPRAAEVAAFIEDRLADSGVDAVDTRVRLASYHRVENTYLATFQALGALGLLLGTLGVGAVLARNVLERQREWGLLRAIGFARSHLTTMVLAESAALVGGGVLIGTVSAALAVAPAIAERGQTLPYAALAARARSGRAGRTRLFRVRARGGHQGDGGRGDQERVRQKAKDGRRQTADGRRQTADGRR